MTNPTDRASGCAEYETLSRRGFLGTSAKGALVAAAAATAPAWMPRVALASSHSSSRDVIVSVFLRGGADALNMIVPSGDPEYYGARPTLGIGTQDLQPLDTFFGLSRGLWDLMPAYAAGHVLFVHAVGSHDPTRSHFDAQRFMETGIPNQPSSRLRTGWLGRHLQTSPTVGGPLRAVALGSNMLPRTLNGADGALPLGSLTNFRMPGRWQTRNERRAALSAMYQNAADPVLGGTGLDVFSTMDLLDSLDVANYLPANGATYPNSSFGRALRNAAALIKADVGVEAIEVDRGGWDTHSGQGSLDGKMYTLMTDLGSALAAFYADIATTHLNSITLVMMSEFGRRIEENGSLGTDHGHGGMMMLLGGNVRGGQVITKWPGLAIPQRYGGLDLEVTTDYRDVLQEIVSKRLGNPNVDYVFPNYDPVTLNVTR